MSRSQHAPWTPCNQWLVYWRWSATFSWLSQKWDFTVCSIYTQAYSSVAKYCEDHPYLAEAWQHTAFCHWVLFCCMDASEVVYPFTHWKMPYCFQFLVIREKAAITFTCRFCVDITFQMSWAKTYGCDRWMALKTMF